MILLALGTLLLGGATIVSSRIVADAGSWGSPQQQYAPPTQYAPPPQYSDQSYGQSTYYTQPEEQYYQAPPANEVRLERDESGMFYANVEYGGRVMNMMVDSGATNCVFGDDVWNWLKRSVHSTNGQSRLADNRVVANKEFVLPYLTAGDKYGNMATAHNVTCNYIAGKGCGLLGQSFLQQCDVRSSGGVMTIRGRG